MSFYGKSDIYFPHLKLALKNLPMGIELFGVKIAFYGILLTLAMVAGFLVTERIAKRDGQEREQYLDFLLIVVPLAIIGARLYYVIFSWEQFRGHLLRVFHLRTGGLAIYGALIAGVLTAVVYCRVKKIKLGLFLDTLIPGLLVGQIIGRFGNFFNREAFGRYANGLFAMEIERSATGAVYQLTEPQLAARYENAPETLAAVLTQLRNTVVREGTEFLSVHPTFLYEAAWNLFLLLLLLLYRRNRRFEGELCLLYLFGYGVGRALIETLRTDALLLFRTGLPVSLLLSVSLAIAALTILVLFTIRTGRKPST